MASLIYRLVKGSPLTNAELDGNFSALNTELGQKLVASSNLSDLTNAGTARSNLGLGNVENKSSATIRSEITTDNVTAALGFSPVSPDASYANPSWITSLAGSKITGSISGNAANVTGTVAILNGGTGAATASGARTNLGLVIGSNVQAWDADLDAIAALAGTSGILSKTAANTWTLDTNSYLTGNQTITFSGDATGSGSTSVSLTLANSGVAAGSYGNATNIPQLTVDAKGRITSVSNVAVSIPSGSLAFNGDVSGTGSTGATTTLTLANSGVTAGTYTKVTVDAKGRVTTGASLASVDLPTYNGPLTSSQITTGLGFAPLNKAGDSMTGELTINVNSSLTALRVTQSGAGFVFQVEDTASDTTPFTIRADGRTVIGGTANYGIAGLTNPQLSVMDSEAVMSAVTWNSGTSGFNSSLQLLRSRSSTQGSYTAVQSGDLLGAIRFGGDDGAKFLRAADIFAAVDGTPGVDDMPGRLVISTTADGASGPTERIRVDSVGRTGFATTTGPLAWLDVRGNKGSTNGTTLDAFSSAFTANDVTTVNATSFTSFIGPGADVALTGLTHFAAAQRAFGASASAATQTGYEAASSLTGATNNYGFRGRIASGTGRWNLYMDGTAANYLAGALQVDGGITGSLTGNVTGNVSGTAASITGTYTGTLTSSQITTGLGFTPYNATNPSGYTTNTGTVTSVGGAGSVSGLTLTGTVTTTGNLTLGGTLAVTPSNFASQTANTILAAPNGAAGVPTFRALVAGDIPTLNQNTTGTAGNVTGTVAVANGGTGATTAAVARTNLGATTLGSNLFTLTNVAAIAFPRINADNTVSALDAATFRAAIGAGTSSTAGTVTSVGGTGTVSGLTLSGTVTGSGNLTLGGTLSVAASNFSSQTANTVLAAPSGSAGAPTFRALVSADLPTYTGTLTSSQITAALNFTPYNSTNPSGYITSSALTPYLTSATAASTYQTKLVSGTSIKTINGASVLGSGDIVAGFSADGNNNLNASGTIDSPAGTGSITMLGLLQANVGSSVAIGFSSTVGNSWSVALGRQALTSGESAISIGAASKASSEGAVAIGGGQMPFLLDGAQATGQDSPIAVGYQSVASANGAIAIGRLAQATNEYNYGNIAIGQNATASAIQAIAIGRLALGSGSGAVAIGGGPNNFMQTKATGSGAVAIGQSAFASGTTSIAIGQEADCNNQDSIVIGGASYSYNNNTIVIGKSTASTAANQITLGNSAITQLRCQVTTITSLSDARDKIVDGKLRAGLDFVNRLSAYEFTWNTRDGAKVGIKDTGFMAQDLKRVQEETGISIPDLVSEIDPQKLEAGYGKLIPIYAVAIQELSDLVNELRSEIQQLKEGI